MTLTSKFKKDLQSIQKAVNGEFYLDTKNPKLCKKLYRFYENQGVMFSGDPMDDYEILMEYVSYDLDKLLAS